MKHPEGLPVLALLVALLLVAPTLPGQSEGSRAENPLVAAANDFGFALAPRLAPEGNLFFSPASIETALLMAWAGARGETATEMAEVLRVVGLEPTSPAFERAMAELLERLDREIPSPHSRRGEIVEGGELKLVNALWGQRGHPFRADYLKRIAAAFRGELRELDFAADPAAARRTINEQVAKSTRERIRDLLPEDAIDAATRLVITNAIYFKNAWADAFQEGATREQVFELAPDRPVEVPMMRRHGSYQYVEDDLLRALRVPYAQGRQSMLVVLPRQRHGLAAVERALDREGLARILAVKRAERIGLELPRFRIEQGFELRDALTALGMRRAFGAGADFGGIDDGAGQLLISRVIHKTFVAVDEKGTEAAAATAVVMKVGSAMTPKEPIPFVCDQPFLFFILDDATGLVLFQGRCADPRG